MVVLEGSTYLEDQQSVLHRYMGILEPLGMALLAASLVGWITVFMLIQQGSQSWLEILLTIVSLTSLAAVSLPYLTKDIKQEAANYQKGKEGEERLVNVLAEHLDEGWTLFTNILIPDGRGDIDAILLGDTGLFTLEVKSYGGTYRNRGMVWHRRDKNDKWAASNLNPSKQARGNLFRLKNFLEAEGIENVPVEARLVWAGDGVLISEEPGVKTWQLAQHDAILEDLRLATPLEPEFKSRLRERLVDLSAESTIASQ